MDSTGSRRRHDLANCELLAEVIGNQLATGRRFLRLDPSRLSFLDCAGLRIIVAAHNQCLAVRGTLALTGVSARLELKYPQTTG